MTGQTCMIYDSDAGVAAWPAFFQLEQEASKTDEAGQQRREGGQRGGRGEREVRVNVDRNNREWTKHVRREKREKQDEYNEEELGNCGEFFVITAQNFEGFRARPWEVTTKVDGTWKYYNGQWWGSDWTWFFKLFFGLQSRYPCDIVVDTDLLTCEFRKSSNYFVKYDLCSSEINCKGVLLRLELTPRNIHLPETTVWIFIQIK